MDDSTNLKTNKITGRWRDHRARSGNRHKLEGLKRKKRWCYLNHQFKVDQNPRRTIFVSLSSPKTKTKTKTQTLLKVLLRSLLCGGWYSSLLTHTLSLLGFFLSPHQRFFSRFSWPLLLPRQIVSFLVFMYFFLNQFCLFLLVLIESWFDLYFLWGMEWWRVSGCVML